MRLCLESGGCIHVVMISTPLDQDLVEGIHLTAQLNDLFSQHLFVSIIGRGLMLRRMIAERGILMKMLLRMPEMVGTGMNVFTGMLSRMGSWMKESTIELRV